MQIAILGRQAKLSLAELEAVYGAELVEPVGDYAALVDIDEVLPQARLGGTIKSATTLAMLESASLKSAFNALRNDSHLFADLPEGKLKLGFSLYGWPNKPRDFSKLTFQFKKALKNSNQSVRLVEAKEPSLTSAQVLYNKLTSELGREFLFIKHGQQLIIARTTGVQNIDDYSKRDFDRPKRDARVGMLPPKLAQIMINLANYSPLPSLEDTKTQAARLSSKETPKIKKSNFPEAESLVSSEESRAAAASTHDGSGESNPTLLDPFCGTGVVLQEAALMGYQVYGSDIEERMVRYTRDNLVWLEDKQQIQFEKFYETADATEHIWRQPVDLVVCEGYLGQPFSAEPSPDKLESVKHTCNQIMSKFLINIAEQLPTGTSLVVGVPTWFTGQTTHHLPMLDDLESIGYQRFQFSLATNDDLIYHREDQVVGRELLVLSKK